MADERARGGRTDLTSDLANAWGTALDAVEAAHPELTHDDALLAVAQFHRLVAERAAEARGLRGAAWRAFLVAEATAFARSLPRTRGGRYYQNPRRERPAAGD